MANKKYSAVDFRKKAEFGKYESVENPFTGISTPKFVKLFTLHYKPHTRTLNQEYLAISAGESETRVIVIRHNSKVSEGQSVRLDGLLYDIIKISPNDGYGWNNYDFITLKQAKKVGGKS